MVHDTDVKSDTGLLKDDILRHIQFTLGNDPARPDKYSCYMGLAFSIRDRLTERWLRTQRETDDHLAKRVYFLSMEFLPGRFLLNYLISLGMVDETRTALGDLGFDLEELEDEEWDAGLGNGGLGRLASCYMDSFACRKIPAYGYGIRYDYGIFHQVIEDGYQREQSDNWLRRGNPWEIQRRDHVVPVQFYGRSESYTDKNGKVRFRWTGGEVVLALACDTLIPGYQNDFVTHMRLWIAQASHEFDLQQFSQGDYAGAVESKVRSENISKVLYPNDEIEQGRELRLKQQYFFVAATLNDILLWYKGHNKSFDRLPDAVAIQLNDTHPSIAVAELMRILVDDEDLEWDEAWAICEKSFGYTNHTVLPEALETWPVSLIGRLLPRHLEITYEINRRFLATMRKNHTDDPGLLARVSLFQDDGGRIRMAHLAIVGSHSVNGVAALHSSILKNSLFKDFDRVFPGRFGNVTNGITPRRWLCQANPLLSRLISSVIGEGWITRLDELAQLEPYADNAEFRAKWAETRLENKKRLARYILRKVKIGVDPSTLFDVHIKRLHEYKRQLLNILHVITLYNRIRRGSGEWAPRTVIFAGKAAPAYHMAKRIIKLINSVAEVVNADSRVRGCLRVVMLPNYCVSQAEKIVPGADLSEQISTAGMEASGTGNMKMALNGALTIGTLDGANVEILEAVGSSNIFIFGLEAAAVSALRTGGYDPRRYYQDDAELAEAIDMIRAGHFSAREPGLFEPIVSALLDHGDYYLLLADYRAYIRAQEEVSRAWQAPDDWTRRSILNCARMGRFSSDRAVMEYASGIWNALPLE